MILIVLGVGAGVLSSASGQEPRLRVMVGTGEAGDTGDGGPAGQAKLNQPFDAAFDGSGNLFLSDTGNHRLRRVDARTGVISTVAGTGRPGFSGDGGPATAATLNEPYGVAVDDAGNVFFADRLNRRVRRVDGKSGIIETVAGTGEARHSGDAGPAAEAGLVEPNDVALDRNGRLYIADVGAHRVRVVVLANGQIATLAGTGAAVTTGDGGPASDASFDGARAVQCAPDLRLYVVERQGHVVRVIDQRTGLISTVAGTGSAGYSGDDGPARDATFHGPKEIAVAGDGALYVVDTENHAVRRIDPVTGRLTTIAGTGTPGRQGEGGPATQAQLDRPHGATQAPDGAIWVVDTGNHRLVKIAK
jgi:sugar lactone lactonase YvrE